MCLGYRLWHTHTHTKNKKRSGHAKSHSVINLKGMIIVDPRVFQCFVHVPNHFDSVLTITKCFFAYFDSGLWAFLLIWLFSSSSLYKKTPNPWPKLFVLSPPGVLLATAPTPEHFEWSTAVGLWFTTSSAHLCGVECALITFMSLLSCIQECCSPPSASQNLRLGSESPGGCCMNTQAETLIAIGRMCQVLHFSPSARQLDDS